MRRWEGACWPLEHNRRAMKLVVDSKQPLRLLLPGSWPNWDNASRCNRSYRLNRMCVDRWGGVVVDAVWA